MSVTLKSLGIDHLSVEAKLDLIEQIWDSLPVTPQTNDIPAWHLAELTRRRDEARNDPGKGRPWRQVLDELEGAS